MPRRSFRSLILEGSPHKRALLERLFKHYPGEFVWVTRRVALPGALARGVDLALVPAGLDNGAEVQDLARSNGLVIPALFRPAHSDLGAYLAYSRVGTQKWAVRLMTAGGTWWELQERESRIHDRYRKLLNRLSDGYLEVDARDVIRWANASIRRAVGRERLEGLGLEEVLDRADARRLRSLRGQHRQGVVISFPIRLSSGQTVEVDPNPRFGPRGDYLGAALVLRELRSASPDVESAQDLFTLYSVASTLTESRSLTEALQGVVDRVTELMGLTGAGVFLLDEQGELQLRTRVGVELDRRATATLTDLCAGSNSEQKARVMRDLQPEDPRGQSLQHTGARAVAAVPVSHQGTPLGVLWVLSDQAAQLGREDVSLLISVAGQLASSLTNHRTTEGRLQEAAARRRFFRDALQAVTRGKLIVCEHDEAEDFWVKAGEPGEQLEIFGPEAVPRSRELVESALNRLGYPGERPYDLALCTSEAVANVIKHAGGRGRLEMRLQSERAFILVEDRGPGIEFSNLPNVVLTPGVSTAPSLGMGYSLLLELCDSIHLCTGEGGTRVILEVLRLEPDPLAAFASLLD